MKNRGYTLFELTLVISILGIIAIAMIPNLSSGNIIKLDLAAEEIANAIRFAKAESIRTGTPHGIETNAFSERVRVYRNLGLFPIYDVRHPIDKKLYDIQLNSDSRTKGVDLFSSNYNFDGMINNPFSMTFTKEGIPATILFGKNFMLTNGSITLNYKNDQRVISIAAMTGRVSIQ